MPNFCLDDKCESPNPSYGKKGTKKAEYCEKHKPTGYVNVRKKCLDEKCGKVPVYGKQGTKKAEYCEKHKPDEYVNVVSKKCLWTMKSSSSACDDKCTIRPSY